MSENDSPIVKPDVVFIEDLLNEIALGMLRVPRFQRPFVWKPKDMLDLFDSIYKGYPIGSLLVWDSEKPIESLELVGPINIPTPGKSSRSYILDGHQRLATLFGTLRLPPDALMGNSQKEWRWWIWFDLIKKEFLHVKNGKPEPSQFPVRALLRTVDFLEQARRIQHDCPDESNDFINETEQLAQKLKSYRVAVIRIKGGSIEQAVNIFSRLNTKGVSITPDQMVSALTYEGDSKTVHLAEQIDEILESLAEYTFEGIDRLIVLQAIILSAGKRIHRTEWERLASDLKNKLKQSIKSARTSLLSAARFLYTEIGVPGDRLLPYSHQILMLSEFFRICPNPNDEQKNILRQWFWCTSLSGWFAGQNTTQINSGIDEMRKLAKQEIKVFNYMPIKDEARPFPDRFDLRSSRVRALILFMLSLHPLNPDGNPANEKMIFYRQENQTMAYVFPGIKGVLKSSPANRILLERLPGKTIKEQIAAVAPDLKNKVLESHGISEDAFQALLNNNAKDFIVNRAQYLAEIERNFISDMGIPISEDSISGETDIDTGE